MSTGSTVRVCTEDWSWLWSTVQSINWNYISLKFLVELRRTSTNRSSSSNSSTSSHSNSGRKAFRPWYASLFSRPMSYDTTPLSLQVPTFKARPRPMLLQKRSNNHPTKPPPATRHRAVMSLHISVPLYDMRSHSSTSLQDILQSSRTAEKVMMVTAVSTNQVSRVEEDPKYLILSLSFYPQDDENHPPKSEVNIVMPNTWTPKMYLSALNKSIRKNSILSIELITIDGRVYATINELQWLFSATEETTHSQLICSASYIRVSGGVLKQV
jgi:hypothetical protein